MLNKSDKERQILYVIMDMFNLKQLNYWKQSTVTVAEAGE
jgi:hypothetical protein